jgi:uncharacterized protein YcaQ
VRIRENAWWSARIGARANRIIAAVRNRIVRDGPLRSSDFEHTRNRKGERSGWWSWSPQKAALEYLWRTGELAVAGRVDFQKRYDLSERVHPVHHAMPRSTEEEHIAWACTSAIERLGIATPREVAAYWRAVSIHEAKAWCERAERDGRLVRVMVRARAEEKPVEAFALADWKARIAALDAPPDRMRLLAPFDPVLRDRARAERLMGVTLRFEAFVPKGKRRFGYYVMMALDGDDVVARVEPKLHRDRGVLEVLGVWWEPGVRATAARKGRLEEAVARLARSVGAARVVWTAGGSP